MNRAFPDMSILERQRARYQQDEPPRQHHQEYFGGQEFNNFLLLAQGFGDSEVKPDPCWPELGGFRPAGFGLGPGLGPGMVGEKERDSVLREKCKKRKADKAVIDEDYKDKKMKTSSEDGDSKITEQNSHNERKNATKINNNKKKENSTDDSKASEVQKPDYIHVRARRGQATDSHSLAERVRREKISERMKYLQDLVPGCNKITGKAGMLDEIINYVQSLQRQVEFLSMKLATVNPALDFNIENLFAKEIFSACTPNFPLGVPSEITNTGFLQLNPLEQLVSCGGLNMGLNISDNISIRTTMSSPIEPFIDSSTLFNQMQSSSNWDANLQSLNYDMEFVQGRPTSFSPHQFAGLCEEGNMKMEMM